MTKTTESATPLHVIQLTIENIKGIRAVRLTPGTFVEITGKNAAGKSVVLDAIIMALFGKRAQPDLPIRQGARKGMVAVTLGNGDKAEFEVVLKLGKTQTLTVTGPDGLDISSPRKLLSAICGPSLVDPVCFAGLNQSEQAAEFERLLGLDLSAHNEEHDKAYSARTDANRDIKRLEGSLDQLDQPADDVPNEEIDAADLIAEIADVSAIHERLTWIDSRHVKIKEEISGRRFMIDELKTQIEVYELEAETLDAEYQGIADTPSVETVKGKMDEINTENTAIRAAAAYRKTQTELDAAVDEYDTRYTTLESVADMKRKEIADAVKTLPIDGLEYDGEIVTWKGLPLAQCAWSQRTLISTAIVLAGAQRSGVRVRVVLIHDGALLDTEHLEKLRIMCEAADTQLIIEIATDGEDGRGIVIQDGEVKHA